MNLSEEKNEYLREIKENLTEAVRYFREENDALIEINKLLSDDLKSMHDRYIQSLTIDGDGSEADLERWAAKYIKSNRDIR